MVVYKVTSMDSSRKPRRAKTEQKEQREQKEREKREQKELHVSVSLVRCVLRFAGLEEKRVSRGAKQAKRAKSEQKGASGWSIGANRPQPASRTIVGGCMNTQSKHMITV